MNFRFNLFGRARLYVIRQRGRTFLLLIILSVALFIGLLGMMFLRSFEESLLTIGEQSNAKITVFTTDLERLITAEQIDILAANENIRKVNRVNEVIASPANFEISMGEGEDSAGAGVRLQGFDDLAWDSLFEQEVTRLVFGSLAPQTNEIVIHQHLAMMNGVSIGDSMIFQYGEVTIESIIAGFYTFNDAGIRNEEHTPSMFRFENLIFTNLALVNLLQGKDEYAEAHFYVLNPNIIQDTRAAFEHEFGAGRSPDGELLAHASGQTTLEIRVSDALFRRIAAPLSQTAGLTKVILAITGIGVVVVVSLLLTLWARERRKETALLMSIGERKTDIVTQRLLEVITIYLFAFTIVIPIVLLISPFMEAFFQNAIRLEDIENFSLAMSAVDIVGVFLAGVMTLIVAITLSSLSVMRLHPKSILSKLD